MSDRGSLTDRPRSTRLVVLSAALFVFAILLQYVVAATPALAAGDCNSFAIFTTDAAGNTNNQNQYDSKPEVYLNGGPTSAGGGLAAGTTIYYQVQEPDGTPLMEIRSTVIGPDGTFRVQLYPFDTTSNSGGEYKVVASTQADLGEGGCTKSDNFKVVESTPTPTGTSTATPTATPTSMPTATPTSTATPVATPTATPTSTPTPTPTATSAAATLEISKSNNAPLVNGLPTAAEGATVLFTLSYEASGMSHDGVITDVLPPGLTYVVGSATSDSRFTFQGFDAGTRTLTWSATSVDASGSVTYEGTVDAGAAALTQPLENVATISSDETAADTATSDVFVSPPPLGETFTPGGPTAPQTDVDTAVGQANRGSSLPLVISGLLGLIVLLLLVTPTPGFMRRLGRNR